MTISAATSTRSKTNVQTYRSLYRHVRCERQESTQGARVQASEGTELLGACMYFSLRNWNCGKAVCGVGG